MGSEMCIRDSQVSASVSCSLFRKGYLEFGKRTWILYRTECGFCVGVFHCPAAGVWTGDFLWRADSTDRCICVCLDYRVCNAGRTGRHWHSGIGDAVCLRRKQFGSNFAVCAADADFFDCSGCICLLYRSGICMAQKETTFESFLTLTRQYSQVQKLFGAAISRKCCRVFEASSLIWLQSNHPKAAKQYVIQKVE